MPVQFYQVTSVGNRAVNQDSMVRIINDKYVLCAVADGLGGHRGGEQASRYFCQSLLALAPHYHQSMQYAPQATLTAWVGQAVDDMYRLLSDDRVARAAYTTCAILYIDEQRVVTAHCGDSRVYRLNVDKILWRTQDHSILQKKINRGEMTEQEMGAHPDQNQLTRSINVLKEKSVEVITYPAAQKGETFVVCSDGFWVGVKAYEWLELAQPESNGRLLAAIAEKVVLRAEGKSDNVSVQWLRCL